MHLVSGIQLAVCFSEVLQQFPPAVQVSLVNLGLAEFKAAESFSMLDYLRANAVAVGLQAGVIQWRRQLEKSLLV